MSGKCGFTYRRPVHTLMTMLITVFWITCENSSSMIKVIMFWKTEVLTYNLEVHMYIKCIQTEEWTFKCNISTYLLIENWNYSSDTIRKFCLCCLIRSSNVVKRRCLFSDVIYGVEIIGRETKLVRSLIFWDPHLKKLHVFIHH